MTCWVWMEMLMLLWRPEFEIVGISSGSWYHCLPIKTCLIMRGRLYCSCARSINCSDDCFRTCVPTISDILVMLMTHYWKRFWKIVYHVLYLYLPENQCQHYHLRQRPHNKALIPKTTYLSDRDYHAHAVQELLLAYCYTLLQYCYHSMCLCLLF